jgi:hypothetical protein
MHLSMAASVIRDRVGGDLFGLLFAVILVIVGVFTRYWRFFEQWLSGIRGKDWSSVAAVIDVVSVVEQTEQTRYGERTIGFQATLTYFYRNPDLQMGEYFRMFGREIEAK